MDSDNLEIQDERCRKNQKNDESTASRSGIETLPREIVLLILSKLPLSSFVQFKLVCRSWRMLAQDPHLVDLRKNLATEANQCLIFHSNNSVKNQFCFVDFDAIYDDKETRVRRIQTPFSSSLPELYVVSSSNGLLCLSNSLNNALYVFNPFTGAYRELPETIQYPKQYIVFGFGFHPTTHEYKAVKIIYYWNNRNVKVLPIRHWSFPQSEVQVFNLGSSSSSSSSWRSLGKTSHYLDDWLGQVLLEGRIHWETRPRRYRPHRTIVSFDLLDEQFREVPKPDDFILRNLDYLALIRGHLSIGLYVNYGKLDIWVMKEYGVKESWVKEFSIGKYVPKALEENVEEFRRISRISRESLKRVLCVLQNDEILLAYHCRALVLYDPNTESFKDIKFQGMPNWFETVIHVGNFSQTDNNIGF